MRFAHVLSFTLAPCALAIVVAACGAPEEVDVDCEEGDVPTFTSLSSNFETNCTGCHASTLEGGARAGAPEGVDFDVYDSAVFNAEAAAAELDQGTMPPFPGSISAEDREQLLKFFKCGTPE